jgi:uncharacterized protein YjbJ (UPF0337 family)
MGVQQSAGINLFLKTKAPKAEKEISMNSKNDNLKGSINSTVGSAKEAAGRTTGNQRLEDEGTLQKTKGNAQKLAGSVKDVVKNGKKLLGVKSDKA